MKAIRATVDATFTADFGDTDIENGSLYVVCLRTGKFCLLSGGMAEEVEQNQVLQGVQPMKGDFWESNLDWSYAKQFDNEWEIRVSGDFAFELFDDGEHTAFEADADITGLLIVFREDGDSPAVHPQSTSISNAYLTDMQVDENFDEL